MFAVWGGMEMDYWHWFMEPKLWQRNFASQSGCILIMTMLSFRKVQGKGLNSA